MIIGSQLVCIVACSGFSDEFGKKLSNDLDVCDGHSKYDFGADWTNE